MLPVTKIPVIRSDRDGYAEKRHMPRSLIRCTLAYLVIPMLSGCGSINSEAIGVPAAEPVYAARIALSDPTERYVGLVIDPPKITGRLGLKNNCLVDMTNDYLVVLPPTMSLVENEGPKARYSLIEIDSAESVSVGERYIAYGFTQTTEPFRPLDQVIPARCSFAGFVFLNPNSLLPR
jgi:uncharacterized protein YceK